MLRLIERIKGALPGVFIHSVRIGKTPEEDRKRSLLDNMNRQIKEVCNQLAGIPELAEGFNAIGLSQGGQFLRAYVERCNKPRVKKLITLGSQHQGVMTLPGCIERSEEGNLSIEEAEAANAPRSNFFQIFSVKNQSNRDFFRRSFIGKLVAFFNSDGNCSWWKRLLKLGVYSPFVRSEVVQAQYFKDPRNLEAYFDNNQFLLDINNDSPDRQKWNPSYADNLSSLDAFYMYIFEEDSVVVPKESGWFALQDPKDPKIKYLKELSIYKEDRLGLKKMDEEGKLFFRKLPGEHLKLSNDFLTIELPQILL
jgi:palmitoyl-protein thioesterase